MSVLKVTKVQSGEVEKKYLVETGQVRKIPESMVFHETIVLIVDARAYDNGEFSDETPFLPIILEGGREKIVGTGISCGSMSAEEVAKVYPILLKAELTYEEEE